MKLTKRQLKRIIKEEGYYATLPKGHIDGQPWTGALEDLAVHQGRAWGHGEVVDPKGFKGQVDKSKRLATGKDNSPLQMTETQLRKIIREYHPRPDDDYDPLDPPDEFGESPEDDMDYDRGLEAGCAGWPRDTGFGPAYDIGYDQGVMDAKDPDSECNRDLIERFGPRREIKVTKKQLKRIIREAVSDLTHGSQRYYTDASGERQPVPSGGDLSRRSPAEIAASNREIPYRDKYFKWVSEKGHRIPYSSSVLASYVIDNGISDEEMRKIAAHMSIEPRDVKREIELQLTEGDY